MKSGKLLWFLSGRKHRFSMKDSSFGAFCICGMAADNSCFDLKVIALSSQYLSCKNLEANQYFLSFDMRSFELRLEYLLELLRLKHVLHLRLFCHPAFLFLTRFPFSMTGTTGGFSSFSAVSPRFNVWTFFFLYSLVMI